MIEEEIIRKYTFLARHLSILSAETRFDLNNPFEIPFPKEWTELGIPYQEKIKVGPFFTADNTDGWMRYRVWRDVSENSTVLYGVGIDEESEDSWGTHYAEMGVYFEVYKISPKVIFNVEEVNIDRKGFPYYPRW